MRERERERVKAAREIFSFNHLLKCYYACRRGKRYTANAGRFELNFESELLKLQNELKTHSYKPGRSICFVVDKPKHREIFAADFTDRIVHHVLVDYLEPIWEKKFIGQSYACRKGKGTHRAVRDLKKHLVESSEGGRKKIYYLQLDIKSFFVSINKKILFELIKRHVKNPEILWLAKTIIFYDPTANYYYKGQPFLLNLIPSHKSLFKSSVERGLPIGNLTSQFFANVYLNELDQFIKHKLKAKRYLRYVDDFLFLSEDRIQLKVWREEIKKFLQSKLALCLHPQKQILQPVEHGINFVGSIVRPDYSLIRRRVVENFKERLQKSNRDSSRLLEERNLGQILSVINSYYGQYRHHNTFGLRLRLWRNNFGKLRDYFCPVDKNMSYFNMRQISRI